MKCQLQYLRFFIWFSVILSPTLAQNWSTSCGSAAPKGERRSLTEDGMELRIHIQHPTLDPYVDIIPNISYQVVLQASPELGVVLFDIEITVVKTDASTYTVIDEQTTEFLAQNKSSHDLICSDGAELSVAWTPETFSRCYNISASVLTKSDSIYSNETIICSSEGTREYYLVNHYGTIESPGFPDIYPDNFHVSYILFTLNAIDIYIQIQFFDLEPSYRGRCFDSLVVSSNTKKILCGAKDDNELKYLNFKTEMGKLMVTFSSDNKIGRRGFKFMYYSYETDECNKTLTTPSGNIVSLGYPQTPFPSLSCLTRVELPQEFRIKMIIKYMNISPKIDQQCTEDSIQVSSSGITKLFCGNSSIIDKNELLFQSSSSNVDVLFTTGISPIGTGFSIEYTSELSCSNQTFHNSSGHFYSNNYPYNYANNQDCFYTINISDSNFVVEILFESFHTEAINSDFFTGDLCNLDYVELYIDDKIERICGYWKSGGKSLHFRSESGIIHLHFVTNNQETRTGFLAVWSTVLRNKTLQCSSTWIETDLYWFEIVRHALSWEEGAIECQLKGGYLATISDYEIQLLIERNVGKRENCSLNSDSFWIGANDGVIENEFYWSNGQHVQFNFWFPGWEEYHFHSKQPSDDGFTNEDCVEIRKTFNRLSKGLHEVEHYYWNDRQCSERNPFICQISKNKDLDKPTEEPYKIHEIYNLNESNPSVDFTSPGFPDYYPNSFHLNTTFRAPFGYNVLITFDHFDLEFSNNCEYDNLTLSSTSTTDHDKVLCGNWNTKLKRISWLSDVNEATIRFHTDLSQSKSGFKLKASLYQNKPCGNNSALYLPSSSECLVVNGENDNVFTYTDAKTKCLSHNGTLLRNISTSILFLLEQWLPFNNSHGNKSKVLWIESDKRIDATKDSECHLLVIFPENQSSSQTISSSCFNLESYACVWPAERYAQQVTELVLSTSKGYVSMKKNTDPMYENGQLVKFHFVAPEFHQIFLTIDFFDIEYQEHCLYDSVSLAGFNNDTRICGNLSERIPLYFKSKSNHGSIVFLSDENTLGDGFQFSWQYVNTVNCFDHRSSSSGGSIGLVNRGKSFIGDSHCCSEISSPFGSRIVLNITSLSFKSTESCVILFLSDGAVSNSFCGQEEIHSSTFVTSQNFINICLLTDDLFTNDEFEASYGIDHSNVPAINKLLFIGEKDEGQIFSPHYPENSPLNIKQTTELVAPLGHILETKINLTLACFNQTNATSSFEIIDSTYDNDEHVPIIQRNCCNDEEEESIVVQSSFNRLKIVYLSNDEQNGKRRYSVSYSVKEDKSYLNKTTLMANTSFFNCSDKTCLNEGHCHSISNLKSICLCPLHFTGMFCQVSWCDLPVCNHGRCELNPRGYTCHCDRGYWGVDCAMNSKECAERVCSGNGVCIEDNVSGKLCSCNKEWTGQNCSLFIQPQVGKQINKSLMDEPIWIGMIAVLVLLLLFGILLITRRRCSKYFKCCEDTDSILKKQAENAIPAHKNYPPTTPIIIAKASSINYGFDQETSPDHLKIEVDQDEIRTPPVDVENIKAAAKLFESYKNKSQKTEKETFSGIVDGQLQFLRYDTEIQSSDNEIDSKNQLTSLRKELRKSMSSLPTRQKEKNQILTKCHSLQKEIEPSLHCYPNIVIVNETSIEDLIGESSTDHNEPQHFEKGQRRKSVQRQKTFDDLDAKKKREAFATKSKSSGTRLDIPPFASQLASRRANKQEHIGRSRSPSLTPTSFESDPSFRHCSRMRLRSGPTSSEEDMSDRYLARSFCSQPDHLYDALTVCKCCSRKHHHRSKHLRMSRRRSRRPHLRSLTSDHSSSLEKSHPRVASFNDLREQKKDRPSKMQQKQFSVPQQSTASAKKVSMHIMEGGGDCLWAPKMPVRKSRSNDLNLNKDYQSTSKSEDSTGRKRSFSFNSKMEESRRKEQHPDDLLNADQKVTASFYLDKADTESVFVKEFEQTGTDSSVVCNSVLTVTDTDTGFSSSSPWRETAEDNLHYKIYTLKDSAYQTKQSSVDRFQYDVPKNSYEQPEESFSKDNDMTTRLHQAAKRLALYKYSQFSKDSAKDSAFAATFSEADDTTSCDSEKSPRELHPALRQRFSNFTHHQKLFPLEQVSEEGDSHTPESIAICNDDRHHAGESIAICYEDRHHSSESITICTDDRNSKSAVGEEIELQEYKV